MSILPLSTREIHRQRALLVYHLRYVQQMGIKNIGAILRVTPETVKNLLAKSHKLVQPYRNQEICKTRGDTFIRLCCHWCQHCWNLPDKVSKEFPSLPPTIPCPACGAQFDCESNGITKDFVYAKDGFYGNP